MRFIDNVYYFNLFLGHQSKKMLNDLKEKRNLKKYYEKKKKINKKIQKFSS